MSASASGRDPAVDEALRTSRLGVLPAEVSERVLAGAHEITVPPGASVIRDGDGAVVLLVVRGLLRTYLATAAGRELTIRYSRAGAIVGVGSLTAQPAGVHVQALAQTRFFSLRTAALSQRRRWSRGCPSRRSPSTSAALARSRCASLASCARRA